MRNARVAVVTCAMLVGGTAASAGEKYPHLILTPELVEEMREKIKTEPWKTQWEEIRANGEYFVRGGRDPDRRWDAALIYAVTGELSRLSFAVCAVALVFFAVKLRLGRPACRALAIAPYVGLSALDAVCLWGFIVPYFSE